MGAPGVETDAGRAVFVHANRELHLVAVAVYLRGGQNVQHRNLQPANAAEGVQYAFLLGAQLSGIIQMPQAAPAAPLHVESEDDTIFLKTDHRVVRVDINDIRYVVGMAEYLKIHLEGQKPLVALLSMKKMEERLPSYFLRIHRSYIVNMKKVVEVTKNRIVMDADTYLPVGDIYKEALSAYLADKYLGR